MPLVQDAMFSRSPRDAVHTAVFIGGKDAVLALDMLEQVRKTLLKPFEISASPIRPDRSRPPRRWSPALRNS